MRTPWVIEETKTVDLEDKRLNDRFGIILDQLAGQPTLSIPAACGGYAETMAAYRFFDNEKVDFEKVLGPHQDATAKRMADQSLVILVSDSTEMDLTRPQPQVAGTGPLGAGSSS